MAQAVRTGVTIKYPNFDGTQACFGVDVNDFYMDREEVFITPMQIKEQQDRLKELCNSCSFLVECREYGIKHERYGYWGGMSMTERERERSKRKIICLTPDTLMKDYKGDWKL